MRSETMPSFIVFPFYLNWTLCQISSLHSHLSILGWLALWSEPRNS